MLEEPKKEQDEKVQRRELRDLLRLWQYEQQC